MVFVQTRFGGFFVGCGKVAGVLRLEDAVMFYSEALRPKQVGGYEYTSLPWAEMGPQLKPMK
jgi:hypothetical protein